MARAKSSAIKVLSVKKGNTAVIPWDRIVDGIQGPLDDPPAEFNAQEIKAWNHVVSLIPPEIRTKSDYVAVATLAYMWAKFLREKDNDTISPAFILQLRQICADLGLNPSARNGMMTAKSTGKGAPEGLGKGPQTRVNPFKLI